ncbi:MAG: LuxR C-terminal-related transcriptional regulator [Pseudomonadota bacterium]
MAEVVHETAADTAAFTRWLRSQGTSAAASSPPLAAARISFAEAVPLQRRCPPAVEGVLSALAKGDVVLLARDGRDLRLALHWLAPQAEPAVAALPAAEGNDERPRLTQRETEALTLAAKGLSAQEVATMLGVSIHTAHSHFKNAYRKLTVRSRAEAVFEATRLGLIAP